MDKNPDVLIIGLGPVGAALASFCSKCSLTVMVIERDTEVYKQPRAVAMDYEVLRQVNLLGVADEVLKASRPSLGYEFVKHNREILVSRYQSDLAPTGYHYANMFHQPTFERALRDKLAMLPNVEVHLGWEVNSVKQDADGVTAIVDTPNGTKSVSASFAVGCDGGRSLVRRSIGSQMYDLGFDEPWLVVDVKLGHGVESLSDKAMQLCDPDRPTTSTQSGPGRHRWEFMIRPGEDIDEITKQESILNWISSWVDPQTVTIERNAVYQFHGLVAKTWRDKRIMIIGDAAHQMPPFLGQGLCSGVRDASNLAWKLAAVVHGQAPDSLLDTVQTERSPHVTAITEAAIALGKIVCITDAKKAAERDRRFQADVAAGNPPPFPKMPDIVNGVLEDEAAGRVLPEPFVDSDDPLTQVRLDDSVGYVPLLILKDTGDLTADDRASIQQIVSLSPLTRVCSLTGSLDGVIELADPSGDLTAMLGDDRALLAKPDRIVFGKGSTQTLADQWASYLNGNAFLHHTVDAMS
ncbi:MAG: bifunctional 3-(3-hydroxy-phenyl)propionate/3-hydroxycinnamic acid hydroxylase [Pseudomonadota bacterium]